MVGPYIIFLQLIALERVLELWLSQRNATWALARGAVEYGASHYVWMKLLHTALLVGAATETLFAGRPFIVPLGASMFVLALAAQVLRYWAVLSLGKRWNTRVLVLPGLPAEQLGPYRYLRHPNYLAVVLEGVAIPMIHTAWVTAIAFTVLNAALLAVRIRCEERALERHCDYRARFAHKRRWIPGAAG